MLPLHPSLKMNVQNMIKITFPDNSVKELFQFEQKAFQNN